MALMVEIEISEVGLRDGERRAVPVDEPVISLECEVENGTMHIYEREYHFAGRVSPRGLVPIYVPGERRERDTIPPMEPDRG